MFLVVRQIKEFYIFCVYLFQCNKMRKKLYLVSIITKNNNSKTVVLEGSSDKLMDHCIRSFMTTRINLDAVTFIAHVS